MCNARGAYVTLALHTGSPPNGADSARPARGEKREARCRPAGEQQEGAKGYSYTYIISSLIGWPRAETRILRSFLFAPPFPRRPGKTICASKEVADVFFPGAGGRNLTCRPAFSSQLICARSLGGRRVSLINDARPRAASAGPVGSFN